MNLNRLCILLLPLLLIACSSWQRPEPVDPADFRQRASVAESQGVTVRALVLSREDGQRLFGADLDELGIEPVWLEVHNDSEQPLWMLQSGADPDYFSPLEVSWSLHSSFARENNAEIDDHMQSVAFARGALLPGEIRQGVMFTNPHHDTKLLNIDLYGDKRLIPFTFFLPIPDAEGNLPDPVVWPYSSDEMDNFSSQQDFKRAVENWFLRVLPSAKQELSAPLTLVLVGQPDDLGAALARRGYRWGLREHDREQQLFGREPDFVLRKAGQGGVPANWIRMWALPMSFQQHPVLVAQVGAPRGGRFTSGEMAREVDPAVENVRDMVMQDMLYSRGLAKLAILHLEDGSAFADKIVDHKVGVLFVAARPLGIAEVLISDWRSVDWAAESEPYANPEPQQD